MTDLRTEVAELICANCSMSKITDCHICTCDRLQCADEIIALVNKR